MNLNAIQPDARPILTNRLSIRSGKLKDKASLVEIMNDWSVAQWLVRPPYPYSSHDALFFIGLTNQLSENGWAEHSVIADRATDQLLGGISLEILDREKAEVAFWLKSSVWGHGYASEALNALMEHGLKRFPHLSKIIALVDPSNLASQSLLKKNSFSYFKTLQEETPSRRGSFQVLLFEKTF